MKKIIFIICLLSVVMAAQVFADDHVVTDKAQLLKVAFEVKPIVKGSPENMVMIYVDLKNVTDKPMMYKMTAILDDKYGGEGIVPVDEQRQKRVAPGETVTGKIAVTYDKLPTNFVLFIDEETL